MLSDTLKILEENFFSCPLVDQPDPEEQKLLAFTEIEIKQYLN